MSPQESFGTVSRVSVTQFSGHSMLILLEIKMKNFQTIDYQSKKFEIYKKNLTISKLR